MREVVVVSSDRDPYFQRYTLSRGKPIWEGEVDVVRRDRKRFSIIAIAGSSLLSIQCLEQMRNQWLMAGPALIALNADPARFRSAGLVSNQAEAS
jgi:hypothetical protein